MNIRTRPAPPRGLFVRMGAFSHSNANLMAGFRELPSPPAFDELDVLAELRRSPVDQARLVLEALRDYGPSTLASRAKFRYRVLRNAAYNAFVRRRVAERMAAGRYAFTLQTQSLFDAATGIAPHFLFTDHVSRARRKARWDDGVGEPSPRWLRLERQFYAAADHVFTFGSGIREMLIADYGIPPEKVTTAGCGASSRPTRPVETGRERYARREILFVGVEWERKGGPELLEAFGTVWERFPDARLRVVGCNPAIDHPAVEVVGRVPLPQVEEHFHRASCFCMPSRLEPFGVVFVEALHFGLPVIATTVGDIADVVVEGRNGHLVPPADPPAVAAALISLLSDPDRCRSFGLSSLALASRFTWRVVAERIAAHLPAASGAAIAG